MSVAAEAPDLKIAVTSVEGIAQRWRGLRRSLEAEHTIVPSNASELVSLPARFSRALGRHADGAAEQVFPRLSGYSCLEKGQQGNELAYSRKLADAATEPRSTPLARRAARRISFTVGELRSTGVCSPRGELR
jgi:hypothetical protein